jgi:glycosyltransferase involved in cell wall biosynthesis
MNSWYVFLKLAKLWERPPAGGLDERMLSLHIDTARTWRGGQNQALLTVLGLRGLGHRTVLVAHPQGELRRRAAEGLDLIGLAPRSELDLAAAWRLARVLKQIQPEIVHAHDPHGVAVAATAIGYGGMPVKPTLVASRRVDFPLKLNALSQWKYRQVAAFLCASECIRQILIGQGIPRERASPIHEGIDWPTSTPRRRSASARRSGCRPTRPSSAASARSSSTRDTATWCHAAADIVRAVPEARGRHPRRGRPARRSVAADPRAGARAARAPARLPARRAVAAQGLRRLRDALDHRRPGHLDPRRDGVHESGGGERGGRHPGGGRAGRHRLLVPPRDATALGAAVIRLLRDPAPHGRLAAAGRARVEKRFTADRMVQDTLDVYHRLRRS